MEDQSLGGPALADNPSNDGAEPSIGSESSVRSQPVAPSSAASSGDTWGMALNEDNRTLVENKGWKSPDDALKSYRELDEYRGRSVAVPGEGATAEEWRAFRAKTGMPEAANDYQFAVPDGADETAVQSLKDLFHGAELDQRQADVLFNQMTQAFQENRQAVVAQQMQAFDQVKGDAENALVEAWGNPEGEVFRRNLEMARRAVDELGGDALMSELRQLGAITSDNQILSPVLAKVFSEVGTQLFAEDALVQGGDVMTVNPFAEGSINLTVQGDLVKRDPARARAFIEAAGKRPESYGFSSL